MGYDKEKLSKLLKLIKTVYNDNSPEVKQFTAGINALALSRIEETTKLPVNSSKKLDDIYEYCLAKNLRIQAYDFYKKFPQNLHDKLVEYYVEMETAHRRNDFKEYCHKLYCQIETVMKELSSDSRLDELFHRMLSHKPKYNKEKTVEDEIYGSFKKDNYNNGDYMPNWPLNKQYAANLFSIIDFFVINKFTPNVKYWEKYKYKEHTKTFSKLRQFRNLEAHGHIDNVDNRTAYQKKSYEEVIEKQSEYYHIFAGLLVEFMNGYITNYPLTEEEYNMSPVDNGDNQTQ